MDASSKNKKLRPELQTPFLDSQNNNHNAAANQYNPLSSTPNTPTGSSAIMRKSSRFPIERSNSGQRRSRSESMSKKRISLAIGADGDDPTAAE